MRKFIAASALALAVASPVFAQDAMAPAAAAVTTPATSPDGSKPFGFEPYFGVLGGYHSFDRKPGFTGFNDDRLAGAVIEGVLGANLPLGPLFIGVEGHGAKGFSDIDWEYGVRGRAGARIGESGLIYGSVGYTWLEAKEGRGFTDRKDWVYGLGVEIGPRDIGLGGVTGKSGMRFRLSAETFAGKSIRPMAGVIFHF